MFAFQIMFAFQNMFAWRNIFAAFWIMFVRILEHDLHYVVLFVPRLAKRIVAWNN